MKKLCLMILALIMSLTLCLGLTACGDKIVEKLQNELGAFLEGGNFKDGSVLNFDKVDITSEKAEEIFEKLGEIGVTVTDESKAFIYDISVTKDGIEIQPNGKVKVTVPMPSDGAENGYLVYHIEDNGEVENIPSTYDDGKLTFETDGFSCYVFVGESYVNIGTFRYQLTVTVEPANAGYVEINGDAQDLSSGILLDAGKFSPLSAVENDGYVFVGWYDADLDEMLAEDDAYDVYMNNNLHLVAKFKETPYELKVAFEEGGSIELNGEKYTESFTESIDRNASVTLRAIEEKMYSFEGWYDIKDNTLLSVSKTYTFTMDSDKYIEAKFVGCVDVTFNVDNKDVAVIEGRLEYDNDTWIHIQGIWKIGTEYTVKAVPAFGYRFLYWDLGGEMVFDEVLTGTVQPVQGGNFYYTAHFAETDYCLKATAIGGGKITVGSDDGELMTEYIKGFAGPYNEVSLYAWADEGYHFVGWFNEQNECIEYGIECNVKVDEKIKLEARFEKDEAPDPVPVEVTLTATAGEGGIVTEGYANGKKVEKGTSITLSATPNNGYHFVGWFAGETKVSDDLRYTFTVNEDTTLEARFEKDASSATTHRFICDVRGNGSILENNVKANEKYMYGVTLPEGTKITLTAKADTSWVFKGWYKSSDESLISSNATYTFNLTDDILVYAMFEEKPMINFCAGCTPYEGGYITENGKEVDFGNGRGVEPNTKITLTAVANNGYVFKGWGTRDDDWNLTIFSTDATYTFTVTKGTYVQAVFEERPTGLKIDAHNAGFTYEDGKLTTTVYKIGDEIKPNIEYVGVYATYSSEDVYLTIDEDYTRDLGGLDFEKVGTYTVTYTYKADTSLTATLTVQVVSE